MKIVFFGTSEFAEIILRVLSQETKHEIAAVVTTPDAPFGRHLVLTPSPVKKYALEKNFPLYQPEKLKNTEFFDTMRAIAPDIIVVAAYGKILPKEILYLPKYNSVNVHGSTLPKYRGAAPIQRAIMDKKKRLGVTVMYMNEGLDTGDIIDIREQNFGEELPFDKIHDTLAENGAHLLIKSLKNIEKGKISPEKQDDASSTYAKKIEKADTRLNFNHSAFGLHCKIRALSPSPMAMATLMTKKGPRSIKIIKSHYSRENVDGAIGETVSVDGAIGVKCRFGVIYFDEIVPEGKNKMTAVEFLRGRGANLGDMWK